MAMSTENDALRPVTVSLTPAVIASPRGRSVRINRWVHPGAWWIWALGLAVAASRTTNPVLLGLIIAVAGFVVAARRPNAPWGRTFSAFLILGAVIIAIRVIFQVLLGVPIGTTVLIVLPTIELPEVFAGVRIGGEVTGEEILAGAYEGLRLATILACVGAANSLASPARLLASVPGALYEAGVAVVIAVTFAPQLISDLRRVRAARRLRGRPVRGLRGIAGSVLPVLEGALERSVHLAAAMDARGYGRVAQRTARQRRWSTIALLGSLSLGLIGVYALLDASVPTVVAVTVLAAGAGAAVIGIRAAGTRSPRTRYRPDPWRAPEWLTAASGLIAAGAFVIAGMAATPGMTTPVDPAQWPQLPVLAVVGLAVALLPAWVTPPPPDRLSS